MTDKLSTFHFFSSLRDFLQGDVREGEVRYLFEGTPSLKDAIEALGVPHPEVGFIRCNGKEANFSCQLAGGEEIEVFPHHNPPAGSKKPLCPLMPPGRPTFIADVHLGRLARYLRVAGFDTEYEREDMGDETIATRAARERRIVLTRDVGLLKRSLVNYGYILRNNRPREQFKEVVDRYSLKSLFRPFDRCVHCNGLIVSIEKEEIEAKLPEGIRRDLSVFFICSRCGHVYWEGSHHKRITQMLKRV